MDFYYCVVFYRSRKPFFIVKEPVPTEPIVQEF